MIVIETVLLQILRIAVAVIVFGVIVVIHEGGHFAAAKAVGVQVNESAIGMGPKLFSFGKKETRYTVRLFPVGGFCAMEGEDAAGGGEVKLGKDKSLSDNPRAFNRKKVWQRVLVTVAGAAMNLLLGFILLLVYFGTCTLPSNDGNIYYAGTQISRLEETTPAFQSGLRPGDTVLKIDNKRVFTVMDMQSLLQDSDDAVFTMQVRRKADGVEAVVTLPAVTFHREYSEELGAYQLNYDFYVNPIPQTIGSTITQSFKTECSVAVMVWRSLGNLITGKYGLNELSGPGGTVGIIGETVENAVQQENWQLGLGSVLMLVVLLTVNVGIFNLLPFPALDGGRLLFLAWEGITHKPVPQKYEGLVHGIGFALLLLLVLVVTFSDIFKIVS